MYNLYLYHSQSHAPLDRLLKELAEEYQQMHQGLRCLRCRLMKQYCQCGNKAVFEGDHEALNSIS